MMEHTTVEDSFDKELLPRMTLLVPLVCIKNLKKEEKLIIYFLGAIHPLVVTHPVTKKKCLYLGRRRLGYIVGLPLQESEDLLNDLWSRITGPTPGIFSSPVFFIPHIKKKYLLIFICRLTGIHLVQRVESGRCGIMG